MNPELTYFSTQFVRAQRLLQFPNLIEKRVLTVELKTSFFYTSPSFRSVSPCAQMSVENTFSVHAIAETTQNIVEILTAKELMI